MQPGRFKIRNQRADRIGRSDRALQATRTVTGANGEPVVLREDTPAAYMARRVGRIVSSLSQDIHEGSTVRVRQILKAPRELYRMELERPDMAYERTTIVDAETLESLLESLPESLVNERFIFRT